jgi:endonuclease/exonuclease/phosphatase family metal-dependent hydrolase
MISFLFWNLMGNQEATRPARMAALRQHVTRLAHSSKVDVFLFAESPFAPDELVGVLNAAGTGAYCFPPSNSQRIQLLTRLPAANVVDQFNDPSNGRLTIRRVTTPEQQELLLAALHFQSQLYWGQAEQALQMTRTSQDIRETEDQVGHQRTVLVGDLNMNPFDQGVVSAQALNAVMTRDLARAEGRTVAGRVYRFFYNPTWGFFGDRTPGPPGSFFSNSGPGGHYWNVFDQVLLRPDLMNHLSELQILDSDGQERLVTGRGRPRATHASDHLPLLFRLAF